MGPRARPVDGPTLRQTASECEVNKDGSLDIIAKVRQGAEAWNQQREKIVQAIANRTKRTYGQDKKVKIDATFNMTEQRFTNRTHA